MRKIMISGANSGVGKTTITAALLSLLPNAQPFKCGPDYIDPMFHEFVAGTSSYNLDAYMLNEETMRFLFNKHSDTDGISVMEGMMGLYDGLGHGKDNFSAAHISRILKAPVILIVDGKKISTSIAAQVKGYKLFDPRVDIRGLIINRVSETTYHHLKEAVEMHTNISCLGYLPEDKDITINERHLGLMQAQEVDGLKQKIEKLKETAKSTIDIEKIIEISASPEVCFTEDMEKRIENCFQGVKVGVARDKAFSFYYKDNIDLMEKAGMEILYFSPLNDDALPEVDCIYLGGGYPEVYAQELSQNKSIINSIGEFSKQGGFIYAECGGMMYLSCVIITIDGKEHDMAAVFAHKVYMQDRLNIKRFGYIECKTADGDIVRGHEFHYSDIAGLTGDEEYYFDISKPNKNRNWRCGFVNNNTIAGYPHIHFYSNIGFFKNLFSKVRAANK